MTPIGGFTVGIIDATTNIVATTISFIGEITNVVANSLRNLCKTPRIKEVDDNIKYTSLDKNSKIPDISSSHLKVYLPQREFNIKNLNKTQEDRALEAQILKAKMMKQNTTRRCKETIRVMQNIT